jgi:hypothetical protein
MVHWFRYVLRTCILSIHQAILALCHDQKFIKPKYLKVFGLTMSLFNMSFQVLFFEALTPPQYGQSQSE